MDERDLRRKTEVTVKDNEKEKESLRDALNVYRTAFYKLLNSGKALTALTDDQITQVSTLLKGKKAAMSGNFDPINTIKEVEEVVTHKATQKKNRCAKKKPASTLDDVFHAAVSKKSEPNIVEDSSYVLNSEISSNEPIYSLTHCVRSDQCLDAAQFYQPSSSQQCSPRSSLNDYDTTEPSFKVVRDSLTDDLNKPSSLVLSSVPANEMVPMQNHILDGEKDIFIEKDKEELKNCGFPELASTVIKVKSNFSDVIRRDSLRITKFTKEDMNARKLAKAMKGAEELLVSDPNVSEIMISSDEEDCVAVASSSRRVVYQRSIKPFSLKKIGSSTALTKQSSVSDICSIVAQNKKLEDTIYLSDKEIGFSMRLKTRSQKIDEETQHLLQKRVALISSDEDEEKSPNFDKKDCANTSRKRKLASSDDSDAVELLDEEDDSVDNLDDTSASGSDENKSDMSEDRFKTNSPKKVTRSGTFGRAANKGKTRQKKTVKPKKKRHRIAMDSDDEVELISDDDVEKEAEGEKGSSQKSIRSRKIISKKKLAPQTIDAERAERERRQRLEQKQLEYNGIEMNETEDGDLVLSLTDTSSIAPALKSLVLDKDKDGEPPNPVTVHSSIVKILKPHQAEGIQFMYNSVFEDLSHMGTEGGGILAHCMGLGKTLQVIAFLHTILTHGKISEVVNRVLVVAPKNVVTNWEREFRKWLEDNDPDGLGQIEIHELSDAKNINERYHRIKLWHKSGCPAVLIIGYPMFRILTESEEDKPVNKKKALKPKPKTKKKIKEEKIKAELRKYLQDPGPDLVVCDEGHMLKNDETGIARAMSKIRTRRRICMTGTPLQNNLIEYHTMVNFVKPGLLGTKKEFSNRFANIIKRGQTKDASDSEVRFMRKRCHVLYDRLKHIVNRRDYRVLIQTIPPKQEYVIQVSLTEKQVILYREFITGYVESDRSARQKRLLADYHIFARIWTHPHLLLEHERESEKKRVLKEDLKDDDDFVVSGDETPLSDEDSCDDIIVEDDENPKPSTSNEPKKPARRSRRLNSDHNENAEMDEFRRSETPIELKGWYSHLDLISEADKNDFTLSNKLVLLQQIIKSCESCGDKLLIFSQSLESLRIIRRMLEYLANENLWFVDGHQALMAEGEHWGWIEGHDFLVIDGSVNSKNRDYIQDKFNDALNLRARLMLISTRAGSLGTNLVSANRVIIFDACWNPSHDTQALFRVYRYGQTKPVYIYRLIAQGTMEQRIYNRQVTKESTAKRVTEEAQIQRHFDGHDLDELYKFDPKEFPKSDANLGGVPRLAPPKDRILADLIMSHGDCIESYMQHDTLFDNIDDEKLSDKEREEAWEEYEREKNHGTNYNLNAATQQHLRAAEFAAYTAGAENDPIFVHCFSIPSMSRELAQQVLMIKRFLDLLLPSIPFPLRGGINEFDTYFIKIINETASTKREGLWLLSRAINAFQTTVRTVRGIAACANSLNHLRNLAPELFSFENAANLSTY